MALRSFFKKHRVAVVDSAGSPNQVETLEALLAAGEEDLPPAARSGLPLDDAALTSPGLAEDSAASPEQPAAVNPQERVQTQLVETQDPLPPLESGASVTIEANRWTVVSHSGQQGCENQYLARPTTGLELGRLREVPRASLLAVQWEKSAKVRVELASPLMPPALAFGAEGDRFYLAEPVGSTAVGLDSLLDSLTPLELAPTLLQIASAAELLHDRGWVHGSIRPQVVEIGQPVVLRGWENLCREGQPLAQPTLFFGYSARGVQAGGVATFDWDLHAIGAILFRVATGAVWDAESPYDWSQLPNRFLTPGVPQILRKCLGTTATKYRDFAELRRDLLKLRLNSAPSVAHEVRGASTIGLDPGRPTNQDAWGHVSGSWHGDAGQFSWTAFVLADGMGGMAAGEVAARVAVSEFLSQAGEWGRDAESATVGVAAAALVKEWARASNQAVVGALTALEVVGGCTLVAGLVVNSTLYLAHVGDCRAYLMRDGTAQLLTRDHSYVMSLVLQGQIGLEDVRTHPDRARVTRSLGDRHPLPDYYVDGLEVLSSSPALTLRPGDTVVICSDGVWEPVSEPEMGAAVCQSASLSAAARELLTLALQHGGPDNATAVLFALEESRAPAEVVGSGARPDLSALKPTN